MVKAIFFDTDGTLRGLEKKGISISTRQVLNKARWAGIRLFIITGRHYLKIEEKELLDDLVFDAYVTLNGQYCYEESPGRPVLYKNFIARDQVGMILEVVEKEPLPHLFMKAHRWCPNYVDEWVERVQQSVGTRIPPLEGVKRVLFHDVYQVISYLDEPGALELVKKLPNCKYSVWHDGEGVDLTPKGGGEYTGIRRVLAYYGIDIKDAAAIGDGNNDVSMLSYTGIGITMGNGAAKARVAAGCVTEDAARDKLAQTVDYPLSRTSWRVHGPCSPRHFYRGGFLLRGRSKSPMQRILKNIMRIEVSINKGRRLRDIITWENAGYIPMKMGSSTVGFMIMLAVSH